MSGYIISLQADEDLQEIYDYSEDNGARSKQRNICANFMLFLNCWQTIRILAAEDVNWEVTFSVFLMWRTLCILCLGTAKWRLCVCFMDREMPKLYSTQ